jgi:hypothetical protein
MDRATQNAFTTAHQRRTKFSFDDKTYSIRRSLMVFSTIVLASTLISPPESGFYEVNILVLKGKVEQPWLLFTFLGLILVYYLVWHIIHCRKQAADTYLELLNTYLQFCASEKAAKAYNDLISNNKLDDLHRQQFQYDGNDDYRYRCTKRIKYVEGRDDKLLEALSTNNDFSIHHDPGFARIVYHFSLTEDDRILLKQHEDDVLRTWFDRWFISHLPIYYGCVALIALIIKLILPAFLNK